MLSRYPGDENKFFIGRMMEYLDRCDRTHKRIFTDFLHPLQVKMAREMARPFNTVSLGLSGGFEGSERQVAAFFPEWDCIEPEDYPIVMLKITDRGWGKALNHRDYLGALLGLGIKREKVGDLVVRDKICFAAVHRDIAGFVETNLERAGRSSVTAARVDIKDLGVKPRLGEKRITAASLRLDGVIGSVFNLSRSKSVELIAAERVRLNWEVCNQTNKALQEGDIISVKGKGKFGVREIAGVTKKGRTAAVIDKYV